jgi:hypothetical protein
MTSKITQLLLQGTYYWKAGYEVEGREIATTEVKKFKVTYIEIEQLKLKSPPSILDFGKTDKVTLELLPLKQVKGLKYQLIGPASEQGPMSVPSLNLKKLPNGEYKLQFFGSHLGKEVSSQVYAFEVKNTVQIPRPKIKRKNQNRFVRFLKILGELLVSTAHAQDKGEHDIEWYETPGSEYQIQIYSSDKKQILKDEIIDQNYYDFIGLVPGIYYWRLREIRKGSSGTFSELEKIEIFDKVQQISKSLMREGKRENDILFLTWDEPIQDVTYQLEIFVGQENRPAITRQVKGGKLKTRLKTIPEGDIYWRVTAIGQWGGRSLNDEKKLIVSPLPKSAPAEKKKPKKEKSASVFYSYSIGKFIQTVGNRDVETELNSPITLGFAHNKKLDSDYYLSSSLYYSRLKAVQISGTGLETKNLRAPYEYGLTGYVERRNLFKNNLISPYGGLDYESFDAYNIDEIIQNSSSVQFRRQNLAYATIGMACTYNIFKHDFFIKLSTSQTIFSNSESDSTYSGRKFLLFLATPIWENWSVNLLLKRHELSGPSDMQITRTGAGFAYHF